ncbi:hypothetical protein [Streptomyces sp. BH104]|uniref:hypothetical protein n=1 Tax=Streptomyces sp. BH104 TaxID=3410407 RepID=UPI003BB5D2C4
MLAVLFVIACPESVNAAVSSLAWLLTDPAGAVLLGVALCVSLAHCAVTGARGHTVRA